MQTMQMVQTELTTQTGGFRLSPQQALLWELGRQGLALPPVVCEARAEGPLDAAALGRALRGLVSRHEILRTRVGAHAGDETPRQVIGPAPSEPPLKVVDLSGLARDERDEVCVRASAAARVAAQDPTTEAPVELTLLKLGGERRRLLLRFSPFCADRAGALNFLRELSRAYEDAAAGRGREDGELQYADISEWQHELLEAEEAKAGRERWKEGVPASEPGAPRVSGAGEAGLFKFVVEAPLAREVRALAEEAGVSEAALLLTCWQVLVSRHGEEFVSTVGVLGDGRAGEELAGSIGPLTRTLPISPGFVEADGFTEAARMTERALAEARRWQDYYPPSAEGARPGFCFEFEPEREVSRAGECALTVEELSGRPPTFAALLSCAPREGSLACELHYDAALIDGEEAASFASRYVALLANVVAAPGAAIRRLEVVGEEERRQLLEAWNDTRRDYTSDACLHQLFEQQATRTPDATALLFEEERLTYRELNERANRLAHSLRRLGVGPDSRVGLLMERSTEMVVALLGTLKAGGAYVPLDPSYPQERLRFMLDDSRVGVLLTQQRFVALTEGTEAAGRLVVLDDAHLLMQGEEVANVESGVAEDNLCYVIYTSGSTGRPKGAMNTHRAVRNRLLWMQDEYGLKQQDRVLQKTPFSFDVSVWEFFWPLMTGAGLVLARPGGHQDAAYLAETIMRHEVTTLHFVPSMLQVFLAEPGAASCVSPTRVICSGEALTFELQERFFSLLRAGLHNLYGPTEAAVDVTYWACERGGARQFVPIGRPIANIRIYLLDPDMNLVPGGAAGELHIGGVGLGRGYLNRPGLTAEKFVPDPFSTEPGARLYKTGDLARHLPEGSIKYLGRIDHQVKIRGLRIELGEIEAAMRGRAGVKDAAVVCVEEGGEKRLVGFYTSASVEVDDGLRQFLSASLPAYMLPTRFVRLDALPVNVNGKTDRKALVELARADERRGTYVAPRTPLEEKVAEVWARLLGHERVSVEDHFFDLGGHSLLATQIAHGLREALQVDVPLAWFFDGAPTVAGLAAFIEARQIQSAEDAELAAALAEIDALSDEEVRALLAEGDPAEAAEAAPLEQV
jgi:amino acid adenylation domain-containing protein